LGSCTEEGTDGHTKRGATVFQQEANVKTILTVDDSASIRQMISFTLKGAGYEVVEASDGEEAYAKAKRTPVSLVLTDHNMPRMDGLTLIKSLRGLDEYKTVPLLVVTTESSDTMKAQGRAAGASGWLVKPFDPRRLLEVVKKVIG
jgi:two-component system, chemotaxis family, chemotaxis protein CheY